MRIIKTSTLRSFCVDFSDAATAIERWLFIAKAAEWQSLDDTRASFPHADEVKVASGNTVTVFNIGGNTYRLIVSIKYSWQMIYIRDLLTHAKYDKEKWKVRH